MQSGLQSEQKLSNLMNLNLSIPDSIPLHDQTTADFRGFLQAIVNRRCVGAMRYGDEARSKKRYMTRISKEMRAYRASGNFENLLNIAMYCFLESQAPENKKFHFDPYAVSATRGSMGGNIS